MVGHSESKLKVFISYAREDLVFADQLYAALEATGFEPLLDRHNLDAGHDFQSRLAAMILESDTVVFILSPYSVALTAFTLWEADEAARLSKRIIPVVAERLGTARAPELLSRLDYIFFYPEQQYPGSGFGHGLARLMQALNSDLDWLREHTRLLQLANEWKTKQSTELLLRGHLIADAQKWEKSRPRTAPEITALHLEFINASEEEQALQDDAKRKQLKIAEAAVEDRERAVAEKDRAQRRMRTLQNSLLVLALLVSGGSGVATIYYRELQLKAVALQKEAEQGQQQAEDAQKKENVATLLAQQNAREAQTARDDAERQRKIAEEAKDKTESYLKKLQFSDEALRKQKEVGAIEMTTQVRKTLAQPNPDIRDAIARALSALPDKEIDPTRPLVPDAEAVLFEALQRAPRPVYSHTLGAGAIGSVSALARPDRIFVRTANSKIFILDAKTNKIVAVRDAQVSSVAPDGKFIVVTEPGRIVGVSIDDGRELFSIPDAENISAIDISHDGGKLGVAYGTAAAKILSIASSQTVTQVTLPNPTYAIHRLVFSDDGRSVLALGYRLFTARTYDATTGKETGWLRDGHLSTSPYGLIRTGTLTPDGRKAVTGATDSSARIWIDGRKVEPAISTGGAPQVINISADSTQALICTAEGSVTIANLSTAKTDTKLDGKGSLVNCGFSQLPSGLFAAWSDGTFRLFNERGEGSYGLRLVKQGLTAAALDAQGRMLMGTSQGALQIWNPSTRSEADILTSGASRVAFNADGKIEAQDAEGRTIEIFDSPAVDDYGAEASDDRRIEILPNGTAAIELGSNRRIVAVLKASSGCALNAPTINALGTLAAALCGDNTIHVWTVYPSTTALVSAGKEALAKFEAELVQ